LGKVGRVEFKRREKSFKKSPLLIKAVALPKTFDSVPAAL